MLFKKLCCCRLSGITALKTFIKMRNSDFVDVSGVPNLVITYGGWIDDCPATEVVLVIPGKFQVVTLLFGEAIQYHLSSYELIPILYVLIDRETLF